MATGDVISETKSGGDVSSGSTEPATKPQPFKDPSFVVSNVKGFVGVFAITYPLYRMTPSYSTLG